jgi:hypothetical protein
MNVRYVIYRYYLRDASTPLTLWEFLEGYFVREFFHDSCILEPRSGVISLLSQQNAVLICFVQGPFFLGGIPAGQIPPAKMSLPGTEYLTEMEHTATVVCASCAHGVSNHFLHFAV